MLRNAETPSYVAVVGKHRAYESSDRTNVALEPERIVPVDAETRDLWLDEAVAHTRGRLDAYEAGESSFSDEAEVAYGGDVDELVEVVSSLDGHEEE